MRPRRGHLVHAVTAGGVSGRERSVCDTGPSSVLDSRVWEGNAEEVTCPLCVRRVRHLDYRAKPTRI